MTGEKPLGKNDFLDMLYQLEQDMVLVEEKLNVAIQWEIRRNSGPIMNEIASVEEKINDVVGSMEHGKKGKRIPSTAVV